MAAVRLVIRVNLLYLLGRALYALAIDLTRFVHPIYQGKRLALARGRLVRFGCLLRAPPLFLVSLAAARVDTRAFGTSFSASFRC